ncbi:arsenate-mycothiol transferase ArsC [Pseudolysinimonas sp.]
MTAKPQVLFLCQHNAGRSQLGAALLRHIAGDDFQVTSAGLSPADEVNDAVAAALDELGIDIRSNVPRAVTVDDLADADYVIAMKPNLALPAEPRGELLVWQFPDPASWQVEDVRALRDSVAERLRIWASSSG